MGLENSVPGTEWEVTQGSPSVRGPSACGIDGPALTGSTQGHRGPAGQGMEREGSESE